VLLLLACATSIAHADDKELNRASVVYARGDVLYVTDGRGKGERELARVKTIKPVRGLRVDARARVLLADLGGTWAWMKLTGNALVELPCVDGPAQLAPDGACVLCRTGKDRVIINLATGKQTPVAIPDAWIAGDASARRLVWADDAGIWSAPPGAPGRKIKVGPDAPLRGFLPSPDGKRAVGVFSDFQREGRTQVPTEILMGFDLDGTAARRKGIRNGVALEWSHDNQYVLVQDGTSACLMRANGGQYKCWKGFTAVGLAPDGSYALVLSGKDLYRAKLDGPYDKPPELVVKDITAATWIPGQGT
jgi:hypothetical protein